MINFQELFEEIINSCAQDEEQEMLLTSLCKSSESLAALRGWYVQVLFADPIEEEDALV